MDTSKEIVKIHTVFLHFIFTPLGNYTFTTHVDNQQGCILKCFKNLLLLLMHG